ncbi:hypothetical protein [Posidoniimonas polymericola]|nr:hypothetical protein [Posidoniimonas polymericola]
MLASCCSLGCGSGSPAIPIPKVNPGGAAAAAMEMYDADADGALSTEEIAACPGLEAAAALYDSDGDGVITAAEIKTRLGKWRDAKIAIVSLSCKVTLDGRPLSDATVTLTPEGYLGDQINTASGVTGRRGSAVVSIPAEVMPAGSEGFRGVNYGTYRVAIEHPSVSIPERYQRTSVLGLEVAPDCGAPYASFELRSESKG